MPSFFLGDWLWVSPGESGVGEQRADVAGDVFRPGRGDRSRTNLGFLGLLALHHGHITLRVQQDSPVPQTPYG